jgi:F-type H+-transporting ATPase subunit delta
MAETITLARPYAKAMFESAVEKNALAAWSLDLNKLALIASNKDMQPVLHNPLVSKKELADLFTGIEGSQHDEINRLITLLAEKKRLNLLPAIAKLYDAYVSEKDKTMEVKVVSAFPIDSARLQRLTHALQNKFKRQIIIQCAVDSALIGGAIIYAGDQVIDGSLRSKLNRLSERLCS